MSRARDLADSADKDIAGTLTLDGLTVAGNVSADGGTIKLDGNYPVGTGNVALGNYALDDASLSGGSNTAIGNASLSVNTSGYQNVAVGSNTLLANTTAGNNVAVGHTALYSNTTAGNNVAVGSQSLYSNTTAPYNTAVGYQSSYTNTTGQGITSVGYQSGYSNTTANDGTAIGAQALYANTTGSQNTAVGNSALRFNTTASNNTAVGFQAGFSNTTGQKHTILGYRAGYSNTTGTDNTLIGMNAGYWITTGSKNTIIGKYDGNKDGLDIRTSSNRIVLSDGDGNPRLYINQDGACYFKNATTTSYGARFVPAGSSRDVLYATTGVTTLSNVVYFQNPNGTVGSIGLNGSSTSYNTSSDYRLKENVVDMTDATTRLKQLQPKRFNFIADADTTVDGFIAHEVQDIVPEAISGTKDAVDNEGNPKYQGIDQSKLVPLLVATIKELEARITALESA